MRPEPAQEGEFVYTLEGLPLNLTYYFRAFVQSEGRTVYGEIEQFIIGVFFGPDLAVRSNDRAQIQGSVWGLQFSRTAVIAHGHVYSSTQPLPKVENSDTTNLSARNTDGLFFSDLANLEFNTPYFYRSYLQTEDTTYYNEVDTLWIGDGWRRLDNLPENLGIWGAIGTGLDTKGYVGFGCTSPICNIPGLSTALWAFDSQEEENNQWMELNQVAESF